MDPMNGDGSRVQPAAAGARRASMDPLDPMDPAGTHYRPCGMAGARHGLIGRRRLRRAAFAARDLRGLRPRFGRGERSSWPSKFR